MRYLYTLLFYLLLPIIFIRLLWRSKKAPDYRKRWGERLGLFTAPKQSGGIWFHAVSVGETLAAVPLIKAIQQLNPNLPITVTTMTPTGSARVQALLGDSVYHIYVPYDIPDALSRFLNKIKPILTVIMETELWPNLIHSCHSRNIPVLLINARLSERSSKGYKRFKWLTVPMLKQLSYISAQFADDANRFKQLGVEQSKIAVTGNVKFDIALPKHLPEQVKQMKQQLGENRFVWIAGSTHDSEEEAVLWAHRRIQQDFHDALLILVPRHPERFDGVAKLCQKQGFTLQRRSQSDGIQSDTEILLIDTMGELLLFYGLADAAFIGGSLVSVGGHNPLEAALWQSPILMGPHRFNFQTICELLSDTGALLPATNKTELAEQILSLFHSPELKHNIGQKGHQVLLANQGALDKNIKIITHYLKD